jgi:predicted peroxiredoxin/TusA-related sulfurtransferase
MVYPGPILEAEKALDEMGSGQVLEVITTDANTRPDLRTWAKRVNAEVLAITDESDGRYRFFVRKSSGTATQPEAQQEEEEKLFLVMLKTGFDYTPIVRSAFMYAALAAAMSFDTVVYCVQAGADTMVADKIDKLDQSKPGKPTIRQRFSEALDMGVRVEVCEQTANVRGIRAEDLLDGVTLKGGALLIDYAARASGQLTF